MSTKVKRSKSRVVTQRKQYIDHVESTRVAVVESMEYTTNVPGAKIESVIKAMNNTSENNSATAITNR